MHYIGVWTIQYSKLDIIKELTNIHIIIHSDQQKNQGDRQTDKHYTTALWLIDDVTTGVSLEVDRQRSLHY